jgi:hypothetical protein
MTNIELLKMEFDLLITDIELENKNRGGDDYQLPIEDYVDVIASLREEVKTYPTS